MSIETMMTIGVAAVIFVSALVLLGTLTLVTRISLLILRPAARHSAILVRRHAPTVAATLVAWSDRLETNFRERVAPAVQQGLSTSAQRVVTTYKESVVPTMRDRVGPEVRRWFTGDEFPGALAPARQRHRRA